MVQPKKYKAKDINGKWVSGWYAILHLPILDSQDNLIGYEEVPSIFNDEQGERSKGSYWRTIQPSTLQELQQPTQLSLF